MDVGWVLPVLWVSLGAVIVGCAVRARRSHAAYLGGVRAVSALWVVAGAGANALFLARGDDYSGFAAGASTSFVQEMWESVVVPHHLFFIGLLILFEGVTGLLVLVAGPVRQVALLLLAAFTVLLLFFGWGYLVWSVPMTAALLLLWRAGRHPVAWPSHPRVTVQSWS